MNVLDIFKWNNTRTAINDLQGNLKCCMCNKFPSDPVIISTCQHSMCSACFKGHVPADVCPKCHIAAPPVNVKPDHTTLELLEASKDLLHILNGNNIDTSRTAAPPSKTNPIKPPAAPTKPKQSNLAAKKKSSTRLTNLNTTSALLKQQEGFSSPDDEIIKSSIARSNDGKRSTEPPFTPPVDAEPLPSVLVRKTPDENNHLSTPNTKTSELKNRAPQTPTNLPRILLTPLPSTPRLDKRNAKGETALHAAAVKGDLSTIKKLLSDGANPNTRDHAGWTPLHEACQNGHLAVAEELLKAGALVDVPSWEANATPLHDAVEHGRDEVVKLLRKYSASDQARDMFGKTPRDIASLCPGATELHAALNCSPVKSLIAQVKQASPVAHTPIFTSSTLTPQQSKQLFTLSKIFRIKVVSDYSNEVTHVIVKCEENRNVCLRTAKFMMGVVAGKWIVSHQWLTACLESKSLIDPTSFEVTGSHQNASSGAPNRARLNAERMLPGLLSGCHVYLHGNFVVDCPSKKDLEGLIKAGGAKLLHRLPNPEAIPAQEKTVPYHAPADSPLARCSHYIIYQEGSDTEPKLKYDMDHIKSLPLSWLIDCIDHFQLLPPFNSYLSQA